MWNVSPEAFVEHLRGEGLRRAWLITPRGQRRVEASHPALAELADDVSADRRDYRRHEGCFFELGEESGYLLTAFVHWTIRGQGAGGVRFWRYPSMQALIRDGLRLSRGMGHKNALAGLWWGGGKGVIARTGADGEGAREVRDAIYRDYGRFVSGLRGCYVTAEDAGTVPDDMAAVHQTTRFTTCIPESMGGSGNPSVLTATGVAVAMEAAVAHLHRTGRHPRRGLRGATVAIQGLGNVGRYLIGELLERGVSHVIGAEIDASHIDEARGAYPGAPLTCRQVEPGDQSILAEPCDIVSPNALGATLNARTIPSIRASVVCGGANNQLEDPERDAARLNERGVLYVPDFLANRMGIVNCANEQYGRLADDPAIVAHLAREPPHGIYQRALAIFERAAASQRPTGAEAEALADELSLEPHPLWPHRGRAVIDDLVAQGWADR